MNYRSWAFVQFAEHSTGLRVLSLLIANPVFILCFPWHFQPTQQHNGIPVTLWDHSECFPCVSKLANDQLNCYAGQCTSEACHLQFRGTVKDLHLIHNAFMMIKISILQVSALVRLCAVSWECTWAMFPWFNAAFCKWSFYFSPSYIIEPFSRDVLLNYFYFWWRSPKVRYLTKLCE